MVAGIIFLLKFITLVKVKNKMNKLAYKFIGILSLLYLLNIKIEYNILVNLIFNIIKFKSILTNLQPFGISADAKL